MTTSSSYKFFDFLPWHAWSYKFTFCSPRKVYVKVLNHHACTASIKISYFLHTEILTRFTSQYLPIFFSSFWHVLLYIISCTFNIINYDKIKGPISLTYLKIHLHVFLDHLEIAKINLSFPRHKLSNGVFAQNNFSRNNSILQITLRKREFYLGIFLHHIEKDTREVRRSKEVESQQNISETFN